MAERIGIGHRSVNEAALSSVRGSRRRRRESGAGRRAVLIHLGFELLDRGERRLRAQPLDEGAAQAASVQIDLALE